MLFSSIFRKDNLIPLLTCSLLLMLPALYNGAPLVTSDSGAYMSNAYELTVPLDRPLGYSIFIRLCSLGVTVWGVIFAQCLLLACLLQAVVRFLLGSLYGHKLFIAVVLFITFATSVAWFSSQLMPDIFTAMLLLAVCIWIMVPMLKWEKALLLAFIYGLQLQHNSNALILVLFSLFTIAYSMLRKKKEAGRAAALLVTSIASLLTFSAMNAVAGKGFRPSAATGVFLMCRLVESGVMDKFLAENCAGNAYNLCAYRDQLPDRQWDFMWNEHSALYQTGGWEANEPEYQRIERKIMTTPKYLALFLFKSTQATCRQLPQIYIGDGLTPMMEGSSPYNAMQQYHRHELKEYRAAQQNTAGLPFHLFSSIIVVAAFLLGTTTLFVWPAKGADEWQQVFRIAVVFLVCNAAVTATFSTVLGRFQARAFWVMPLLCILYLIRRYYGSYTGNTVQQPGQSALKH